VKKELRTGPVRIGDLGRLGPRVIVSHRAHRLQIGAARMQSIPARDRARRGWFRSPNPWATM